MEGASAAAEVAVPAPKPTPESGGAADDAAADGAAASWAVTTDNGAENSLMRENTVRMRWLNVASAVFCMRWDARDSLEIRKQHCAISHTFSSLRSGPAPHRMQFPSNSSSFMSVTSSSWVDDDSNRQDVVARAMALTASRARGYSGSRNPYRRNLFTAWRVARDGLVGRGTERTGRGADAPTRLLR